MVQVANKDSLMQFSFLAKRMVILGVLAVSLLAGGCVRMAHPILKDDQVTSNDALLGKWVSKDGKGFAELRPGDNNRYKLTYTNEDGKTSSLIVRFGKIGDTSVAELSADAFTPNMGDEYKSLLVPVYMMVVIDKTQPQLVLRSPSIDWFKKFAEAHPDQLEVNNTDDLIIQANTDDFQAFFTKHLKDDGILGDPAIFVHPGDPTTQPAK
jgi:hypothetical protein